MPKSKKTKIISTFGSRITSIASVALVLFLLGLTAMGAMTVRTINDDVRSNMGFVIKMEHDVSVNDVNSLKQTLMADPAVQVLTFLSPEEIMEQESLYLSENIGEELDINPYQAEFDVRMTPEYAGTDSIAGRISLYESAPGVDEIITESALVAGVDSTFRRVGRVMLIIALVFLFISIALINNTVSLSIYSRRFVIHTMRLVGATSAFVRAPFIRAGCLNGAVAGVLASVVLAAGRSYAASVDPLLGRALDWPQILILFVALTAFGVLLCGVTAWVAATRYLSTSYDELFLK